MDLIVYVIFLLMAILAVSALYILLSRPKEIAFGILNILKSKPSTLEGWFFHLLTWPIWFPLLPLDKRYNWGIYTNENTEFALDDVYPISSKLYFNFSDCQRFILVYGSTKGEILASLDECYDTTPDFKMKVKLNQLSHEDFALDIDQSALFNEFNYLIQWFATFCPTAETIGIVINNVQKDNSFYLISDTTQKHTNSFTGKTLGGLKFSVNYFSDYGRGTWLGLHEEIKLDRDLNLNELMERVDSFLTSSK